MKTVCKKLLSIMLVAILLVSAVPFQASAAGVGVMFYVMENGSEVARFYKNVEDGSEIDIDSLVAANYTSTNPTGYDIVGRTIEDANVNSTVTINGATHIYVNIQNRGTNFILTLNAGDGKFADGTTSKTYNVTYGQAIPEIASASLDGYTFTGWTCDGDTLTSGQTWNYSGNKTFVANYSLNTSTLQVKAQYYVNKNLTKTVALSAKALAESQFVLEYLYSIKHDLVSVPAGYSWNGMFYDHNGTDELTQQDLDATAERSVVVKFTANSYTLYFNANGGSVTPTSKTVVYDAAVGTLPTPTKKGGKFIHWEDENGNIYTDSTIYKVAGDTQLIARWDNEAQVALAIHHNFKYDKDNKITSFDTFYVQMNGYIVGDEITRAAVETVVKKYFTGSNLKLTGLYTDAAWEDYVAGKGPTAEATFTVANPTTVHVAVTNGTVSGSTNSGSNDDADPTNPKTGDMIGVSLALMMSTGGAALMLGKKRKF